MKNNCQSGETRRKIVRVGEKSLAHFPDETVHAVYGTFALGRDAEWVCRQFVREMKEKGEEGVGTYLSIHHESPAPLGAEVEIVATLRHIEGDRVDCDWEAFWAGKRIAYGQQQQRVLDVDRFAAHLAQLRQKIK